MGKLTWILLIALCLIAVNGKKGKETKEEAATATTASSGSSSDENETAAEENDSQGDEKDDSANADESAKANEEEPKGDTPASDEENGDAVAKSETTDSAENKDDDAGSEDDAASDSASDSSSESSEEEEAEAVPAGQKEAPEFACNLKFKRVGCYADQSKKEKPLRSFIMTDADLGTTSKKGKLPKGEKFNSELPKFACKCANEAINSGNAIFGLQNIAECWTGPDDSKYDKDGESQECVTFNLQPCDNNSIMCAGKKHANFVYYVDTPEHTKSKDEIQREYAEYKKKVAAHEKKKALKKKAAKKLKKKSKKSKKE